MKRIILFLCMSILAAALCCATASAATANYTFDELRARLTLDDAGYDMILTPSTLEDHQDWLTSNGVDLEQTRIRSLWRQLDEAAAELRFAGVSEEEILRHIREGANHD